MPTTLVILLNIVMSLLAVGVVAVGLLLARRLEPGQANDGGRGGGAASSGLLS